MRGELSVGLAIAAFVACSVQVDAGSHDIGAAGGAGPGLAGASGAPDVSPEAGAAGVTNGISGAAGNTALGPRLPAARRAR